MLGSIFYLSCVRMKMFTIYEGKDERRPQHFWNLISKMYLRCANERIFVHKLQGAAFFFGSWCSAILTDSKVIIMFIRARHWTMFWASWIQFTFPHHISLTPILNCLTSRSDGFPTTNLYAFLIFGTVKDETTVWLIGVVVRFRALARHFSVL